jgi:hypothetical protein
VAPVAARLFAQLTGRRRPAGILHCGRQDARQEDRARMTETVLVTGGSGFLAGHTINRLLDDGYRVRCAH